MSSAPLPPNETERLLALRGLGILDTGPESFYDDVTRLAAHICQVPKSLVSLVDADRQWFKSRVGVDGREADRATGFCPHAILGEGIFEIADARLDPRFSDNPDVLGPDPVVFYAGCPLDLGDGTRLGTLCVFDSAPKSLSPLQREALRCLANQVEAGLRLRKAHADLRKAHRAQSAFLAAMGHEVRNPLNGILGLTSLLLDSSREPGTLAQLKIVQDCGRDLLALLNDLLDFSKLAAGKLRFESVAFDLHEALGGLRQAYGPPAAEKGVALTVDAGGAPRIIHGDPTRVKQILANLVANAIRFSSAGTVSVRAEARTAEAGRLRLELTVADQGVGIAPEARDGLFRPFSQAEASTARHFGGTGLGLAIVKELAEAMGGGVEVDSEPGKGSTFTVTLLCGEEARRAEAPAAPGNRDARILVADDNPLDRLVAQSCLSRLGYASDTAGTGEEALRCARSQRYDLILLGCAEPGGAAAESARRLRGAEGRDWRGKGPAIIGMASGLPGDDWKACGLDAILEKPLEPGAVRDALSAWLRPRTPGP